MTTQQAPAGLDVDAEAQRMQDAGVPPEQSVAMLYAAISVSETHIAGMQAGIEARFDALETGLNDKIEALDTKIEKVSREVKDLDTRMSAEIKVLGGKIEALDSKIDTKIEAVRESIKALDTGLSRKIDEAEQALRGLIPAAVREGAQPSPFAREAVADAADGSAASALRDAYARLDATRARSGKPPLAGTALVDEGEAAP